MNLIDNLILKGIHSGHMSQDTVNELHRKGLLSKEVTEELPNYDLKIPRILNRFWYNALRTAKQQAPKEWKDAFKKEINQVLFDNEHPDHQELLKDLNSSPGDVYYNNNEPLVSLPSTTATATAHSIVNSALDDWNQLHKQIGRAINTNQKHLIPGLRRKYGFHEDNI